jgi:HAD superfamily hydrolase (TIGR01458 family)
MQPVRGLLFDIDGVLHVSMHPIPGALETLSWLDQQGYAYGFISNTTTLACATLAQRLQQIGLPVSVERLITAPVATARYIRQHFAGKRCWLLTKGDTAQDFADIDLVTSTEPATLSETAADVVVIGGAEELLTYEAMNAAFRMLMNGASLLAMHTNLYWRTQNGLQLDSGPFIQALEIASGQRAIVVGKPARAFFEQALPIVGVAAQETVMVGDDIENDIDGAQKAGMRGILVYTGKHRADSPLLQRIHPDAILASIADIPQWLQQQR